MRALPKPDPLSDLARQFDSFAETWDAEHGPASLRAFEFAARIRYLRALCHDLDRPRVLDLGCATGQTLLHLADVIDAGLGVDISPAMISQAHQNTGAAPLRFRIGDAAGFCAGSSERFDLVLLIGVMAHFPDPMAALAGVERVLTPKGRLVIISPHPWGAAFCLKRLIDGGRDAPPTHHLSPLELRRLAAHHGLELSAIQPLPYAPWPKLSAVLGRWSDLGQKKRRDPFAGVLSGAFVTEFRRASYHLTRLAASLPRGPVPEDGRTREEVN